MGHTKQKLCAALVCVALPVQAEDIPPNAVLIENARIEAPLSDALPSGWRGVNLYMEGACVGCHENPELAKTGLAGDLGPKVGMLGEKYSRAELRAILVDPSAVFGADTPMPGFYVGEAGDTLLNAQQVEDIIAYLMEMRRY
jgi:sulfur-oxidizing protein SoxX